VDFSVPILLLEIETRQGRVGVFLLLLYRAVSRGQALPGGRLPLDRSRMNQASLAGDGVATGGRMSCDVGWGRWCLKSLPRSK